MKYRTVELEGALLDAAVAKAHGFTHEILKKWPQPMAAVVGEPPELCWASWEIAGLTPFCPSTDWKHGGPIIERERITILAKHEGEWAAVAQLDSDGIAHGLIGPTPLIAAMRAFVASKLGDQVELP